MRRVTPPVKSIGRSWFGTRERTRRRCPGVCFHRSEASQPASGNAGFGATAPESRGTARVTAMGRPLPLDFSPANGRNCCSPLIDRRHAKVRISMSQPPLTQPRTHRASNSTPNRDTSSVSAFLILGCNPRGGAAQPPPGRASSRLTGRPARIWQARRLPRCRDSAPCFPTLCAREAAARLSGSPFSYKSVPPWSVATNACHRPSYQAQHS